MPLSLHYPPSLPLQSLYYPYSISTPTWTTVVQKEKKKAAKPKPIIIVAKLSPPTTASVNKKGITMREKKLIIKLDDAPLSLSTIDLKDNINEALCAMCI
ncbi:hypothetical protein HOY82DRAFT_604635 [Tuber indicum]|nr:hypothetical protein HOY82DRAFT_604635 [Tuber indicum]